LEYIFNLPEAEFHISFISFIISCIPVPLISLPALFNHGRREVNTYDFPRVADPFPRQKTVEAGAGAEVQNSLPRLEIREGDGVA